MWYANSCGTNVDGTKRRDFRVANMDQPCGCSLFNVSYEGYCANLKSMWTRVILDQEIVNGKRTYRANRPAPEDGRWTAFFIDIKYREQKPQIYSTGSFSKIDHRGNKFLPIDKPGRLEFTTEVSIVPNTFPYPECAGAACDGPLV